MFLKTLGIGLPVAFGGLYVTGALDGGYSRDVDRSPSQVAAALADLDISEQPGAPGTDPSRSGGVAPLFVTERTADGMSWTVMSGKQVATRMTASFAPLDGGRRTRVTAQVERGSAPDDFVSPAFRSEGVTMGLFTMALEAELNELVQPARADAATCEALMAKFAIGNMASADLQQQDGLVDGIGDTATIAVKLAAFEAELRRNGCDTSSPGGFREISNEMGSDDGAGRRNSKISYRPGKPMVDVSR